MCFDQTQQSFFLTVQIQYTTMKYLHILTTAIFIISMSACRKETIRTDETNVNQPPVESNTIVMSGLVREGLKPLSNVQVEVYQGEKLAGVVTTDASGVFNTAGYSIKEGDMVTFYAKKADHISTAKRITASKTQSSGVKITMSLSSKATFPTKELENPGDNDLIVVSGYVTNPDNLPAIADINILYDVKGLNGDITAEGAFVETDETGYFETLMPKDSVLYFLALQSNITPNAYYCQGGFINAEDFLWVGFYPVDLIGPFSTNTQLPTLTNAYIPQTVAVVTGTILDCNGSPVSDGYVKLEYQHGLLGLGTDLELNPDGTFVYSIDLCNSTLQSLKVQAFDRATNKNSSLQTFMNVTTSIDLGNVTACN
jgi:plastocyanin